ncbi:MAG: enoyl-CoA hydratase/isomerase family protein [Deltaproteobacteria bacterium]|nr:enoyl-CoA hydratase/isomerase family protein [Deltaproteobacteria bacterium]
MHRKIRKVAVIGSGVMGGGIAALLAGAGIKTLLPDIVPLDLKNDEKDDPQARNRIAKAGLDAVMVSKPSLLMQKKDAELISIGNLEDDFDQLATCDWIVEVVVENLKIKHDLFQRIEGIRKPGSIVSSNTSGIPLEAMSKGLSSEFRQYFLGTHFFNPVRYMKLLEIIPGEETLPEVLDFMADFGGRILGKGIVWAKDTPNFVGNRIGIHGMVKAMQIMLEDGLTIPEVDALFGPALGRPKTAMFRTADLVGLDVLSHVAGNTYELVTDDESRDSFVIPDYMSRMIDKNLLGKKTSAGFYKTDLTPEWKKIRKVIDPATLEGSRFAWKAAAANLIYSANRIPEISDTIVEIDNAMKWGFNFEMGPFETWDAIGVAESVQKMEQDGLPVPGNVKAMLAAGHTSFFKTENGQRFYFDFTDEDYKPVKESGDIITLAALKADGKVIQSNPSATLVDLGDGVACLEFHTKMNSLNQEIITAIHDALDHVDANGKGLVFGNQAGGMPGAFSAGADLSAVRAAVDQGRFSEIEEMIKGLQYGLAKARYAAFPVVAAPYGMTLGGGCEVCLASDKIVAHTELFMGFVEFGVGLLPAGGGCLALWRNFVASIPDAVPDADLTRFFIPAFMAIGMAKVSMSAAEARANGFLRSVDRIVFNKDYLIGEAKKEVLKMVDEGYTPPAKRKIKVLGEAAQGMVNAQISDMQKAHYISEYDAFVLKRIAYVMSGGAVRSNSMIDEDVILTLEREAFVDLLKEEKTIARIDHMLKTGKPLRN